MRPYSFIYIFSMAAFTLQRQSWICQRPYGLQSLKYLLSGLLRKGLSTSILKHTPDQIFLLLSVTNDLLKITSDFLVHLQGVQGPQWSACDIIVHTLQLIIQLQQSLCNIFSAPWFPETKVKPSSGPWYLQSLLLRTLFPSILCMPTTHHSISLQRSLIWRGIPS